MSEQIDWSKAPEWATKRGLIGVGRQPIWFNKSEYTYVNGQQGGRVFLFDGPGYPIAGVIDATERPTTKSWSGEGLPPVGVDLQWFSSVYGWIGGKVVAHDEQTTIVRHNDGYEGCYLHNLKPCKTTEQIAADEREAALIELIKDAGKSLATGSIEQAAKIYDAGWRKHPKP